jgi:hypothetical protein
MGIECILKDARKAVEALVPPETEITNIKLEGPVICIYTKQLDIFAEHVEYVKSLAQTLRKRVAIRPDPSILVDTENAERVIKNIIPKEAEIVEIYFEYDTGEVTIEAQSPGLAIGRHGSLLNEIKKKIGWVPKVVRTPPIPSKTIREIREYLRVVHQKRIEFLEQLGKRLARSRLNEDTWTRCTSLGGYRQVGRSATLLMTKESKILIDCGVDISSENESSPFLNIPEVMPLDSIDAVIVTHAHLDHSGLVPALFKYGYDGPLYCTPPTRDLMSLLQLDYIKVMFGEAKKSPYESSHIRDAIMHCLPLKYGETTDITPDVRLTFQNAGHILGSAIAHLHIGEGLHNIGITGDFKFEKTWLFNPAINKFPRLETLLIEATYGGYHDTQPSRLQAAEQLRDIIQSTVAKKGKVVIPVFAVGRSQEVMLVLEEQMRKGLLPKMPVYLDGLIWEATAIHTAYPEYLNTALRTQIFQQGDNPFLSDIFKRVDSTETRARICDDPDPFVVLATSGMLNGGPVIEYLKAWAPDPNSTLVFVGYQAEGTLGRKIQKGWTELQWLEKGMQKTVEIKMNVETCDGFSGHSDRLQLLHYVELLEPRPHRVLVCHGEESKCVDFSNAITKKLGIDAYAPYNLETIRLR